MCVYIKLVEMRHWNTVPSFAKANMNEFALLVCRNRDVDVPSLVSWFCYSTLVYSGVGLSFGTERCLLSWLCNPHSKRDFPYKRTTASHPKHHLPVEYGPLGRGRVWHQQDPP